MARERTSTDVATDTPLHRLVGDHRQLPELEAGGAFRGLVRRGLAIELTENQRQVARWERRALDHISAGRAERALALYVTHDRVRIGDTTEQTRSRLVHDRSVARAGGQDAVMIAYRRADVADLNARARDRLRVDGELRGCELQLPGGDFAAGDLVVIKRNELELEINNGDRGRVLAVDPDQRRLVIECEGRTVELGAGFLEGRTVHGDPTLLHGYAITCHVAQGLTVDRAFVLGDHGLTQESGYTALSRGRHANYLYATRQPDELHAEIGPTQLDTRDPLERLAAALKSRANSLAIDSDPSALIAAAQHRYDTALADRQTLEQSRWKPGRGRKLDSARQNERIAADALAQAQRVRAEHSHSERPFVTERDVAAEANHMLDRLAERRLCREHERSAGRELGR